MDSAQRRLLSTGKNVAGLTPLLRMQAALEEKLAWHRDRMAEHERAAEDLTKLLQDAGD